MQDASFDLSYDAVSTSWILGYQTASDEWTYVIGDTLCDAFDTLVRDLGYDPRQSDPS